MTQFGLVLLASDDPVTIQQFSHALEELSISPDVCREAPAAVGLLNRRKFDAVIAGSLLELWEIPE
jgi:CheY-like chemotaxis protein